MRKLVLGPGPGFQDRKKQDLEKGIETIGIDIIPEFEPDYCFDIEEAPLTFKEEFDKTLGIVPPTVQQTPAVVSAPTPPAMPVEPVVPVSPISPIDPVGPTEPVEPVPPV
jgi:hypothetical protein